jgi:hypothetical protein
VIANGYLRLDPQEWIRAVEKRRAALGLVRGYLGAARGSSVSAVASRGRAGGAISSGPSPLIR